MSVFQHISDAVNRVTEWVGSIIMVALVVVIFAEVFARYILNSSLSWSEEFGRILFAWTIFLGTSIGYKRGAHMGLHFITEMAPDGLKRVLSKISILCSSIFLIFIVVEGFQVTLKMASQLTPAMEVSAAWQLSSIPIGALLMLIHTPALLQTYERVGDSHGLDTPA